jgi:hypothetical protein
MLSKTINYVSRFLQRKYNKDIGQKCDGIKLSYILPLPLFRIRYILVRIRILGTVPLTKGSGSGSGSCSFRL